MKKLSVFTIILAGLFFLQFNGTTEATTLHNGKSGAEVRELQQTLSHLGYFEGSATGYYGSQTENAVRQLQRDFHLSVDGIAGPVTHQIVDDIRKMARVVHGEARGESYEGKVAVASVILNRVEDRGFPSTIHNVIFQRNAFTAVHDGQYNLTPEPAAYQAVKDAWLGWDPSRGATYYYNPDIATSEWIFTRDTILRIGNHLFAE
ncbi:cell wall hydrolase [Evansella clarkii]|uniref:cell wall hydrolase n=1 Tax=Evansella clarkii TaxID=79879 RepID=UPI0009974F1D|nr:cell wall hydrolase [Evansella clarkii]